MATFKTSAIVELVDKTKKGAASAIKNFGKLEKAADGFGKEADKSADKAGLSFQQFTFQQKKTQDRLNDLRGDLRSGKGDFQGITREIDDTADALAKLNRENRGFRVGQSIGRGLRGGLRGAALAIPIIGGGLAALAGGGIALTKNFAEQADEAQRVADSVGVAVESYTALQFVSKQLAGEDGAAALPDALKELNKRIGELRKGEGTLLSVDKNFQSILLSAGGTEDAFVKIRKEIKRSGIDSQELGVLLDRTFGEAGFRLTRLFQASNDEFSKLTMEAREVGVVLDQDATGGARKFLKELNDIKGRLKGIGFAIGGSLAEPLANIFDEVIEPRLKNFQEFISNIKTEDVERAFRNVAKFLEDALAAVSGIASIVDAFTTSKSERERNEILAEDDASVGQVFGQSLFLTPKAQAAANQRATNQLEGQEILSNFEGVAPNPLFTLDSLASSGFSNGVDPEAQRRAVDLQIETNRLLNEMLRQGESNTLQTPFLRSGQLSTQISERQFSPILDEGSERFGG